MGEPWAIRDARRGGRGSTPHRVELGGRGGGAFDDAQTTRVEWELTEREDGGTTLYLRESGFLTDSSRQENDGGWDQELGELVELLAS